MSLSPGIKLGAYEIVAPLGAGGMGEVYRARDSRLKREVAIKVLPDAFAEDPQTLARFEREALAVAALSHPNILSIYDFGSDGGIAYAVMELLEGDTLRAKLAAGPPPEKLAVEYTLQIAKGLSAAHQKGVVHRDLKPENVFVGRDGHVKILDFGLAKRTAPEGTDDATGASTGSLPGTVMGTLGYMSPEQVRGRKVDHRSDIFSLGAMLYELLSGKRAFKRDSAAETMAAILNEEPPALSESGRSIPLALEQIVKHCLEKEAGQRFQSVRDIAFALETLSSPSPVTPAPVAPRAWKSSRLILVAAGFLVLLGVGVAVLLHRRAPRVATATPTAASPSIAVLPFTNMSSDKDQEYFSDGLSDELISLLAKVKELHVTGRTSSFAFKGRTEDLPTIGRKLNVASVLEGSVRRSGDRLRVSIRLLNVADGYQIWAETYDRRMTDVFALQDEIAAAVVVALKVKLLPEQPPVVSQHRTSNPEAYKQYLLGWQLFSLASPDGFRRAVAVYDKAIDLDPSYAAAYAGLARALTMLVDFAPSAVEQTASRRRVLWAAEKAVALDPTLAEGYAARANARTYSDWDGDWGGAEADFSRALSLHPGDPTTHAFHGRLLYRLGRLPEAIAEERKAIELEPLWAGAHNMLGYCLYSSGQLAEARQVLTRALEISPDNEFGHFFFGVTALLEHDPQSALSGRAPFTTVHRKTMQALAEHDLGHERESQRALDELIAEYGDTAAYRVAQVYAWRGDADRAFAWLDRAYAQHDTQLPILKVDPLVARLRRDPRYKAMVKKLNLPEGR